MESAKVMVTLPVLTRFEFLFVIDSSFCFLLGLSVSRMLGEKANCKQFTKNSYRNFFYKKSGGLWIWNFVLEHSQISPEYP